MSDTNEIFHLNDEDINKSESSILTNKYKTNKKDDKIKNQKMEIRKLNHMLSPSQKENDYMKIAINVYKNEIELLEKIISKFKLIFIFIILLLIINIIISFIF